jgi:HAD superfamily hydrolase (TIGR01509 family)
LFYDGQGVPNDHPAARPRDLDFSMNLPPEITTIVLDFNGVIASDINAAARSLGDFWGLPLDPAEAYARWRPIYLKASLGQIPVEQFWKELRASFGLSPAYSRQEEDRWLSSIVPLEPDVAQTLGRLGQRFTLGLLTNYVGSWTRGLLAKWGLTEKFRAVLVSSEMGARKPDLAPYREICRMLEVRPGAAVYVADEEEDVVAAERVGMFPVFLPGEDKGSRVGMRIERLADLE